MLDQAELLLGRYNGGQNAPIGSFWNPRSMAVFQQTADGVLPPAGTWIPITTSGSSTLTACANAINAALGTSYTSASLHTYTTADNAYAPGQMTNDA